ncbi:hypothetical protein CERZMDRAFT_88383 [Cercospora zeae-maydis SCOH1-5]|uniref:Uncharacterized protein n=1 Tax=Cercospora zeae-maydis SCOH1-5 TaxID=717836 RepID=A0A6A6F2Z8_9PEZI|nr:hypothetical protein CERZMDRAFT_88383 [Cercospora zeae-maydis SCOH1-5]
MESGTPQLGGLKPTSRTTSRTDRDLRPGGRHYTLNRPGALHLRVHIDRNDSKPGAIPAVKPKMPSEAPEIPERCPDGMNDAAIPTPKISSGDQMLVDGPVPLRADNENHLSDVPAALLLSQANGSSGAASSPVQAVLGDSTPVDESIHAPADNVDRPCNIHNISDAAAYSQQNHLKDLMLIVGFGDEILEEQSFTVRLGSTAVYADAAREGCIACDRIFVAETKSKQWESRNWSDQCWSINGTFVAGWSNRSKLHDDDPWREVSGRNSGLIADPFFGELTEGKQREDSLAQLHKDRTADKEAPPGLLAAPIELMRSKFDFEPTCDYRQRAGRELQSSSQDTARYRRCSALWR